MKKIWFVVMLIFVCLVAGVVWYVVDKENGEVIDNNVETNGKDQDKGEIVVRSAFFENFFDGELDDFWHFDDKGNVQNSMVVDNIREEMVLTAAGGTSQWSNVDNSPLMYFLSDKQDFEFEVEFDFNPKADFQHAGFGVFDTENGEWARMSRSYDTHSLEGDDDLADSIYLMEKINNEVFKYDHINYVDSKVYGRLTKTGEVVLFEFSRDGKNWLEIGEVNKKWSNKVGVYLFVYSTNPNPISVIFDTIRFDQI